MSKRIILNFDGACTNNKTDGDLGLGYHAQEEGDLNGSIFEKSEYGGIGTSNEAEYLSLINGLTELLNKGYGGRDLKIIGDSALVINQMNKSTKTKKFELLKLNARANDLISRFNSVEFEHVLRGKNSLADKLSKEGIKHTTKNYFQYKF